MTVIYDSTGGKKYWRCGEDHCWKITHSRLQYPRCSHCGHKTYETVEGYGK